MNFQQLSILDVIEKKSFYQTIPQTREEKVKSEKVARWQEDFIYEYMSKGGLFTCWDLKEIFPEYEMTSIRRALWNLENKKKKIVQEGFVMGPKGVRVGQFKVK